LSIARSAQVVLKGLTLLPILVLLFYTDPPIWVASLYASHFLAFFLGGLTILAFAIVLKRRSLAAYLELSKGNLVLGLIFLVASASMYLSGYYLGPLSWFHFQSLLLLLASYISLRFDPRIVKTLAIPLLLVSLTFPSPVIQQVTDYSTLVVYISAVLIGLSALVVGVSFKRLVVPLVISGLSILYLFYQLFWFLPYLIPGSLLLTVPSALRYLQKQRVKALVLGTDSEAHQVEGEFCLLCGKRVASAFRPDRMGLIGLAVTILAVYVIFSFQVPTLSYSGSAPFTNLYSRTGVVSTSLPQTPTGWLVNTTHSLGIQSEIYSEKMVFVPAFHPEVSNYTLYYELSYGDTQITRSWGDMPPWNLSGSESFQVGSLSGHLVTYSSKQSVMLVFTSSRQLHFQDAGGFTLLNNGLTFQREFGGVSSTQAKSTFYSDLNNIFVPVLRADDERSVWTDFLSRATSSYQAMQGFLLAGSVSGLILWGAHRVELFDIRQEKFLTKASELNNEEWKALSNLVAYPRTGRTGYEIAKLAWNHREEVRTENILGFLKKLERLGMIRRVVSERGSEVLLLWKLARR
jgi:hypothetical protein